MGRKGGRAKGRVGAEGDGKKGEGSRARLGYLSWGL